MLTPSRRLPNVVLAVLSLLSCCCWTTVHARQAKENRRDFQKLDNGALATLANLGPAQWESVDEGHLQHLLIPRVSGTDNSTLVQNYISSVFSKLGWHEEKNTFTDPTPIGDVTFNNLIYTFDPSAARRIVLTAHYDSKWFPDFPANQFIGATDSAAPCAMLLDLAESLTPLLAARRDRIQSGQGILRDGFDEEESADTTLTILFLDGEEAFHDWTDTDSIYGARHLSQLWEDTYPEDQGHLGKRRYEPLPTYLETIDHFVLLDLLGNKHSRLHSYYRETDWLFDEMSDVDRRLRERDLVEVEQDEDEWFQTRRMRPGMIGDDHLPFVHRGVSVLHVISNPFPQVWHTLGDDASVLSIPAMRRWNRILRVFAAEYLGLVLDGVKVEQSSAKAARTSDELQ